MHVEIIQRSTETSMPHFVDNRVTCWYCLREITGRQGASHLSYSTQQWYVTALMEQESGPF